MNVTLQHFDKVQNTQRQSENDSEVFLKETNI